MPVSVVSSQFVNGFSFDRQPGWWRSSGAVHGFAVRGNGRSVWVMLVSASASTERNILDGTQIRGRKRIPEYQPIILP